MRRSELYQLEKLIGEVLENNRTTDSPGNPDRLAEQVKSAQASCAEVKAKWTHVFFSSAKEQVITRYVQYHQAGITQLSDRISGHLPAINLLTEIPGELLDFCEHILNELERLLLFLKQQCYRYFDVDYPITIHNCRRKHAQIDDFRRELISYSGQKIDLSLVKVIGISVQEMVAGALQSGISYRQTEHILNLLQMVQQLIHAVNGTDTDSLAWALYRQNLNTLHFLNWYQGYILSQINQLSGKHDREIFITREIKTLATIFVDPEKALEPELPPIDLALLPWLQEQNGIGKSIPIKTNGNEHLPLNLSVHQFALFIRIFFQAGCFPNTSVSKITRFFSKHFTTKKQSNVSFKSFYRAFYSLDQPAAAIVRDYLQKMINYLNKTYFP